MIPNHYPPIVFPTQTKVQLLESQLGLNQSWVYHQVHPMSHLNSINVWSFWPLIQTFLTDRFCKSFIVTFMGASPSTPKNMDFITEWSFVSLGIGHKFSSVGTCEISATVHIKMATDFYLVMEQFHQSNGPKTWPSFTSTLLHQSNDRHD